MDPTETLMHEHRVIERMLRVLTIASQKAENDSLDTDLFEKAIDFIRTFADKCHHSKEEGELFPLFVMKGIPNEGGPIGMMLKEHDIGRSYVKAMEQALLKYGDGDQSQSKVVSQNAQEYINLLSQHIQKEDNILYPMGNRALSDSDRETLNKKFEAIEISKVGKGVHEKYHHLVEDLENRA
jgi:hemerythrin-like domain-containing protein